VLIPTAAHIRNLNAARLAADVMGTPTLVVARTDAEAAKLLTSDIDERDQPLSTTTPAARSKASTGQERHRALHRAGRRLRAPCDLIGAKPRSPIWPRPRSSRKVCAGITGQAACL